MEQFIGTAPRLKMKPARILAKQKDETLAAYYTPHDVAQVLTDWALTDIHDTVFDPSFGGCSFLTSAQATLRKLGNAKPEKQIYGVDRDPDARKYLKELIALGADQKQFKSKDFFSVDVSSFNDQLFSAIVGNPPYLRYHDIPGALHRQADSRLRKYGLNVSGRASYWAYFLLYSIQFLRRGGRLAMVLPGALLHTDYSAYVKEYLAKHFETVNIYLLQERIFKGTQEESVIVCAEGAGIVNRAVRVGYMASVRELTRAVRDGKTQLQVRNRGTVDGGWLRGLLNEETSNLYDELLVNANVIRLGDWVKTRIGVVTGNNNYFIMSDQARVARKIPKEYFVPVVKRISYISRLIATNRGLMSLKRQGKDYLLLYPTVSLTRMPKSLRKYLAEGAEMNIPLAWKCKSRKPWYVVPHVEVPEAFMPCMVSSWPRLIVNRSNYTCTNNIFRLVWKDVRPASDWKRLALGTLSTLSQLSAELVGRSYGGGVLKLEPSELSQLAIPLLPIETAKALAEKVDTCIRQNDLSKATEIVDEALINANPKFSVKKLELLRRVRKTLFMRRWQHGHDIN